MKKLFLIGMIGQFLISCSTTDSNDDKKPITNNGPEVVLTGDNYPVNELVDGYPNWGSINGITGVQNGQTTKLSKVYALKPIDGRFDLDLTGYYEYNSNGEIIKKQTYNFPITGMDMTHEYTYNTTVDGFSSTFNGNKEKITIYQNDVLVGIGNYVIFNLNDRVYITNHRGIDTYPGYLPQINTIFYDSNNRINRIVHEGDMKILNITNPFIEMSFDVTNDVTYEQDGNILKEYKLYTNVRSYPSYKMEDVLIVSDFDLTKYNTQKLNPSLDEYFNGLYFPVKRLLYRGQKLNKKENINSSNLNSELTYNYTYDNRGRIRYAYIKDKLVPDYSEHFVATYE